MKTTTILLCAALGVGLVQHAFGFCNPSEGRWLSRDPLDEAGFELLRTGKANLPDDGPNHYALIDNNPINSVDALGLASIPKDAEECYGAHPLYPDDPACDKYGERKYARVILRCFCKCPVLRDPWSNYVRGCLSCMDDKGVPVGDAHEACYASADKNYTRPTNALLACYCQCRR